MKQQIKKRIEKALTVLRESQGSTVKSIEKIINKDSPRLSLPELLKALQNGLNDGFLHIENGRFKMAQQMLKGNSSGDKQKFDDRKNLEIITSVNDFSDYDDNIEEHSEKESPSVYIKSEVASKKKPCEPSQGCKGKISKRSKKSSDRKKALAKKKTRVFTRQKSKSTVTPKRTIKDQKLFEETDNYYMFGHSSKNAPGHQSSRRAMESTEMIKQKGPRCTSMKKDIKVPNKVEIPYMALDVPQKTNIYNDLLRRSPESINGPLFDRLSAETENIRFFSKSY